MHTKRIFIMRGSINNQVGQLWSKVDGIGISKKDTRSKSEYKGQNGHKVSEQVHALRSKDEFVRIAKELAKYARENFKIKDMQQINKEVITAYVNNKIEDGLYRRSISSYVSVLGKVQVGLSKMDAKLEAHKNLYTQQDLKEIRVIVDTQALKSEHVNRAYVNPQSFQSHMNKESHIAVELQLKHGLRVNEATLIRSSQLLANNTLRIHGKGGYVREVKLSEKLYQKIQSTINEKGSYHQSYNNYTKDLKNATEITGEKWNSTHGLRYNYAQAKLAEYRITMDYKTALAKVSHDLGHHRVEITNHYLK